MPCIILFAHTGINVSVRGQARQRNDKNTSSAMDGLCHDDPNGIAHDHVGIISLCTVSIMLFAVTDAGG